MEGGRLVPGHAHIPGGGATTTMHDGTVLPNYFRDLADAWRGFDGVKSFASLEGEFSIEAHHDGLGTAYCEISLGQPWPPKWALSLVLDFGAGAHLEGIARDVEHSSPGSTYVAIAGLDGRNRSRSDVPSLLRRRSRGRQSRSNT